MLRAKGTAPASQEKRAAGESKKREEPMAATGEDAVIRKGKEILRLMEEDPPAVFGKKYWAGKMMEAAMGHPEFKVALFRFIDVLPALNSTAELTRHIEEYFLTGGPRVPEVAKALLSGAASGLAAPIASLLIKRNITSFSKIFIAGKDPRDAAGSLREIWNDGGAFTVDLLGEAAVSEAEADRYRDLYLSLVDVLSEAISAWPPPDPVRVEHFPALNVSVKVSSLYSRIGPLNYDDSLETVKGRLRPIFRRIRQAGGQVHVDMETFRIKDLTLDLVTSLLEEPEFRGWDHVGVTLQAYLKCTQRDVERIIRWTNLHGRRITLRLVKGAYWEYEKTVAGQHGWPLPVFTNKSHTDWNYEKCVELALANHDSVSLAVASHNVRSLAKALVLADLLNVPRDRYEFQALYGMAEPIRRALGKMGHAVREYVPVGELVPGMAYLVRRLLENTSNEGFLRKRYADGALPEELLKEPEGYVEAPPPPNPPGPTPFRNEPPLDFADGANREAFREAIARVGRDLGMTHPVVFGGKEHETSGRIASVNPHDPDEVVCLTSALTREMADQALAAAREAQPGWGRRSPGERAAVLFRAAGAARRRRVELAAWEVFEVGKTWGEADADVCEAIDFLEYYGREMIRLGGTVKMGEAPGEDNRYFYQPRGVGLVVAPWNFPLAISVGMVCAALVAGNAVLYKPSSLSLKTGWLAFDILREAGIPDGVLNFIPGRGSDVGDYLVEHPFTDFILFTGSLQVGLGIVEKAGRTREGQKGPKRVVIETGGKNAIIVDADADLDQAVPGVIQSAFGFQGQKCSACSRVIVLSDGYDRFVARLVEAVRGLPVGDPKDPKHFLGPVVDAVAQKSILGYILAGKRDGKALVQVPVPAGGFYVPPTVFVDLPPDSNVLKEEIFGPVLSILRVKDIDEAIAAANASAYALTGGLYSRSPANIEKVSRDFSVGNLYINRGITGAIVGRQPFGGFRMSGVGSKSGGPDYLQQFMEPRVVTENTMRRGFTPEESG
jgi:RHH-type proline utilization regulon transcriptional repressor/proline dehydrogenase/delta 1-pyrroline-5-carboxylate dehydrogenase